MYKTKNNKIDWKNLVVDVLKVALGILAGSNIT